MNERKGEVFSIAEENAPVEGCTVSKAVAEVAGRRISHFALADGKAKAVSDTTDANGESVKQAIEGCPVAVIRETE